MKYTWRKFINTTLWQLCLSIIYAIYYIVLYMLVDHIYTGLSVEIFLTPYKEVVIAIAYIITAVTDYIYNLISELKLYKRL